MRASSRSAPFPLACALRSMWRQGYSLRTLHHDALAGLVVSLIALPLAMALAIAVGLPPQHGVYTAIVAGAVAALLGGSTTQVSGPTAAFVAIVAPIVTQHGMRGLILATLMAGIMLILLGCFKVGRLIHYMPHPVTTGFTAGIAVLLATLSLNDLLGLGIAKMDEGYLAKLGQIAGRLPHPNMAEAAVGLASLAVMVLVMRTMRRIPAAIVGVGAGALIAAWCNGNGHEVATIGSRFTYASAEGLKHGIPPFLPQFHWFSIEDSTGLYGWPKLEELRTLFPSALVIAALAALESLLSATVADNLTGTRHDADSELTGIGCANIASALVMGIPATGAIARTATSIKNGAKTPVASIVHAVLIALYVMFLAPVISYMPMASLAALLMVTAYHMSHWQAFMRVLLIAPRSDGAVLLVCFFLTVFIDMVAGVTAGIVLASFLFAQRMAAFSQSSIETAHAPAQGAAWKPPPGVMIYHIGGPLFYGTVQKVLERSRGLRDGVHTVVIDMDAVPMIDMSGLVGIRQLVADEVRHGRRVILCGSTGITESIRKKLASLAAESIQFCESLADAMSQLNRE